MELDDRPIATTSFPWMRTGLALGTMFAALFAALDEDAPPPVLVVVPTVVPGAVAVGDAPASASPFAPIDVPWPPGEGLARGRSSSGNGSNVKDGDSPLSRDEAERFFEKALAPCAPTRFLVGKSVSYVCETASEESRALIVPRAPTGTWLQTSRTLFSLPSPTSSRAGALPDATCGWTMRFVALPPGAFVSDAGGSTDRGHCTFEVDGMPALTWSRMLANVFRAGTAVQKRQLDDGELTRWTAEAWDGGWWRIDVISASAQAQAQAAQQRARVELTRWAPGETPWTPPFPFEKKLAALEACWEPCSLALRSPAKELGPDARAQMKASDVIDRCLYECRGTEEAPAILEPAARAFR